MKYAPLPWVHIADALRPSVRKLRIVLEEPAFTSERTFVRLHDGTRSESIVDTHPILKGQTPLSARERAAIEILHEAGPSHAKKGRFALTRAQVGRLLAFAQDVPLEVEGKGAVAVVAKAARISGRLKEVELVPGITGTALIFEANEADGARIDAPMVLGEREAYLLDDQLKLYRVTPPLLPGEATSLLMCEPLMLQGLTTDDGKNGFEAVVGLGVELSDLMAVAKPSDPAARLVLRAMLTRADDGPGFALRVHLVTELGAATPQGEQATDEVEVSSRGALPPVHAVSIEPKGKASVRGKVMKAEEEEGSMVLVARPSTDEEMARQALFDLGLHAAGSHRGFTAIGEVAIDILVRLQERGVLPDFVRVDSDSLPRIVRLPAVPMLNVRRLPGDSRGLLSCRLDLGEEAMALALQFDDIVKAVLAGRRSLLLDEDTVLGFTPEAGQALELIADTLELKDASSTREIGPAELALLIAGLEGKVNLDTDDPMVQKRIEEFLKAPQPEDLEIPKSLTAQLRPYQHEGVAWLSQMHRLGVGRILADDMGLGKTLMSLTLLAKAKEREGQKPSLVVAPTSVLDVWVQEAKRHVPDLTVLKWHGRDRAQANKTIEADIVVTSYALLRRDVDGPLGTTEFRYLMLDEAQNVKNATTEAWKAARLVKSDQRMALTGTPIENRVEELWSIMDLTAPGLLGTERSFERRYGRPIAKGDMNRLDELRRRTRPVILRRKKADVAKDLPPKIETILRCEMEPAQRSLYLRVLAEVRSDVQKALHVHTRARARAPILAALMRLRQVCCDPRLVLGSDDKLQAKGVPSAKLALFEEVMKEALAEDKRKVIVFSQFVEMQKLLFDAISAAGERNALWLHGGSKNRGDIVSTFQDENGPRVIVVSLKAGGTGVTLTAADTVVHYDPWWNPAVEDQATDRAHRIGQERTVHVIKLACEDTIEERMLALGDDKRQAAESVLGKDGPGPKALSLEDIESMLEAEASRGF